MRPKAAWSESKTGAIFAGSKTPLLFGSCDLASRALEPWSARCVRVCQSSQAQGIILKQYPKSVGKSVEPEHLQVWDWGETPSFRFGNRWSSFGSPKLLTVQVGPNIRTW